MAAVETNFLEHEAEFKALIVGFNFTLPGRDQSLARDLAAVAAQSMIDRSIGQQHGPAGAPWPPLNAAYKARKEKNHGVGLTGVLTGQMLSLTSMMGSTVVTDDEVTLAYGTGEKPTRFATHGDIKGDEPTDTQKAEYFTDGGRPFFELDEADAARIYDEAAQALVEYLEGF